MATLALNAQVMLKWSDDSPGQCKLYELLGITTGDIIDLSPDFRVVKRAVLLGITVAGAVVASNAGNVITIPAGVSADGAYLLVYGVHF